MITVVGEALVDLLISPSGSVEAKLGGAPFNTARACGRLGADVQFVGALSIDRFGSLITERLLADRVSIAASPRVDLPTTLAAAELDERGAASYRFYIEGTSAPMLDAVPDVGGVWFAGGLGLVLEPMAGVIEAGLTGRSRDALMIDVNCRPLVVGDREGYVGRVGRVMTVADIVKVSDDDLAYLSPGVEPMDAARALLDSSTSVVLLTAGAAGVHVLTPDDERFVPADTVDVVDTVGAGDSFGAGFITAWCDGGDPRSFDDVDRLVEAARFGARVAAIVVGRHGADPPWRDELDLG